MKLIFFISETIRTTNLMQLSGSFRFFHAPKIVKKMQLRYKTSSTLSSLICPTWWHRLTGKLGVKNLSRLSKGLYYNFSSIKTNYNMVKSICKSMKFRHRRVGFIYSTHKPKLTLFLI